LNLELNSLCACPCHVNPINTIQSSSCFIILQTDKLMPAKIV
jgi:hypothetical protein